MQESGLQYLVIAAALCRGRVGRRIVREMCESGELKPFLIGKGIALAEADG